MDNRNRAKYLFAVASMLEALDGNPYRVRAYRRAAVGLHRLSDDAAVYLDAAGELPLPWLGARLRKKLGELVRTDRMCFQEELIGTLPAPMRELIAVPGIGPHWAERLSTDLKVRTVPELIVAAREGRLRTLYGIGKVRERQFSDGGAKLLAAAQDQVQDGTAAGTRSGSSVAAADAARAA